MTKAELIEKIAKDAGIPKAAAKIAFESTFEGIKSGLKKRNSRVTLVGFGTFKNVYRKTRMGRNPQTGEQIKIKGRNAITFKASKPSFSHAIYCYGRMDHACGYILLIFLLARLLRSFFRPHFKRNSTLCVAALCNHTTAFETNFVCAATFLRAYRGKPHR